MQQSKQMMQISSKSKIRPSEVWSPLKSKSTQAQVNIPGSSVKKSVIK